MNDNTPRNYIDISILMMIVYCLILVILEMLKSIIKTIQRHDVGTGGNALFCYFGRLSSNTCYMYDKLNLLKVSYAKIFAKSLRGLSPTACQPSDNFFIKYFLFIDCSTNNKFFVSSQFCFICLFYTILLEREQQQGVQMCSVLATVMRVLWLL